MKSEILKKPAALVGCAVGDALGVPWEMNDFDSEGLKAWKGDYVLSKRFLEGGPLGQWSDDTQLSVALTSSILEHREFIPEKAAEDYLHMFLAGTDAKWIAGSAGIGGIRGIGRATRGALQKLAEGVPWWRSGTPDAVGNGTAMRATPLGVLYRKDYKALREASFLDARITHDGVTAGEASYATSLMAALLANDFQIKDALEVLQQTFETSFTLKGIKEIIRIAGETKKKSTRINVQQTIGTEGHATKTVLRCLYVMATSSSFGDAVTTAVRGGGDADTAAAIVGAWAGIHYGTPPKKYLTELEEVDRLRGYDEKLWDLGESAP